MRENALVAIAAFRHERLVEPLERYVEDFEAFQPVFEGLIEKFDALRAADPDISTLAALLCNEHTRRALCYLTAPPISDDDLKTLAETASFSAKQLKDDPQAAYRIRNVLFGILDPKRFPWVTANRSPTATERDAAVMASAALVATQRVHTFRRGESKKRQEKRVEELLHGLGFNQLKKRPIPNASIGPKPGEFMGETSVAGARADVVAGLRDGRLMLIECKVSNSTVNSYKRLVHDTGGKATTWYREIGRANIVVAAVLAGVYSFANLEFAQNDKQVFLFWDHHLDDLGVFIKQCEE